MNITPKQALYNLYQASRMAPAVAADHDVLRASFDIVQKVLSEVEDQKKEPQEKGLCEDTLG